MSRDKSVPERHWFGNHRYLVPMVHPKNLSEPKKIAIHQSRVTALLRSLVHFAPIAVALFEMIINWQGRYVGATFDKQSYYQFVAKVHEIAIQASLASITLSYIRLELAFGDGLPFGAFLGGIQFLQISYLWSAELWCSFLSKKIRLMRIFGLLATVVVCSLIAATSGPSSADLLYSKTESLVCRADLLLYQRNFSRHLARSC